ncbi:MAG: R3H domain-containing nucleic acid-binding protein [Parcubacteria group bacterium]|jgi:spoIIIJ-associated protein
METQEEVIREVVEGLVKQMGFTAEVEIKKAETEEEKETIVCNIKTEESNFLIGQYGVNLQSLQHIARILVRKKIEDPVNFVVDVNSYRQEKNSSIEKIAREMAEQAVREQRAVIMRPMSPYERRLVHLELSKNTQIKTESVGEGEERKVVIKPADLI